MSSPNHLAPRKIALFPKQLQFALTYAEESSKRVRWIVFLLQLAVVLVIYSVWQQHDLNWAQARLDRAQAAVTMLTCHPEDVYNNINGTNPIDPALVKAKELLVNIPDHPSREQLDDALSCKEIDAPRQKKIAAIEEAKKAGDWKTVQVRQAELDAESRQQIEENKKSREYLAAFNFSLAQAKTNLIELRKLRNTRTLTVGVPIIGIIFDVNDLSLIAAFTFAIILSWLHFSLRREEKNVKKVFRIAEEAGGLETLQVAYDLHAMTQVLTIPPGSDADTHHMSPLRRWSRLPTFIIGTALVAEIIALWDDFNTMPYGERLTRFVTHAETAIAANLLIYITYRTVTCFRLNRRSYTRWVEIYGRLHHDKHAKPKGRPISDNGIVKKSLFIAVWATIVGIVFVDFMGFTWHGRFYEWMTWYKWMICYVGLTTIVICGDSYLHVKNEITEYWGWIFINLAAFDVIFHVVSTIEYKQTPTDILDALCASPLCLLAAALYFYFEKRGNHITESVKNAAVAAGRL